MVVEPTRFRAWLTTDEHKNAPLLSYLTQIGIQQMAKRRRQQNNGLDSWISVGLEALETAVYAAFRAWWDHQEQPRIGQLYGIRGQAT